MPAPPAALRVYVAVVATAATAAVATGFALWPPPVPRGLDLVAFALLAVGLVATGLHPLKIPGPYSGSEGERSVEFVVALQTMAIIVFGGVLTMALAGATEAAADLLYRRDLRSTWFKVLFNAAAAVLVVGLSAAAYRLTLDGRDPFALPYGFLALLALVAVALLADAAVFAPIHASLGETPLVATVVAILTDIWPSFLSQTAVGILMAYLYASEPWLLPLLLPPLLAIAASYRRLVAMRRETRQALIALADVVESRDPYTASHSRRVAGYALATGRRLGLDSERLASLDLAGRLHDLGKVGVDNAILHKPAALDADETAVMHRHPELSTEILEWFELARGEARHIRSHHERWDGSGYPAGLAGEQITLEARILAVADAYDAMTSDRPYRSALPVARALAVLQEGAGSQFDTEVVTAFVAGVGETGGDEPGTPELGSDDEGELRRA